MKATGPLPGGGTWRLDWGGLEEIAAAHAHTGTNLQACNWWGYVWWRRNSLAFFLTCAWLIKLSGGTSHKYYYVYIT